MIANLHCNYWDFLMYLFSNLFMDIHVAYIYMCKHQYQLGVLC